MPRPQSGDRAPEARLGCPPGGEASVARSWEAPGEVIDANVTTSLNVLEAVRAEAPEAKLVVACSGEEYGRPQTLPVDETHPLEPRNPYATSKAMVDLLAGTYAAGARHRVIRTRAFNHAGPGQSDTLRRRGIRPPDRRGRGQRSAQRPGRDLHRQPDGAAGLLRRARCGARLLDGSGTRRSGRFQRVQRALDWPCPTYSRALRRTAHWTLSAASTRPGCATTR